MSRKTTLGIAEIALSKGAYRECLLSLESLLESAPLLSTKGGKIGILMITALIGQGKNGKALSISEILSKHKDDSIRQQAKQLISILKSPELTKPKDWSVTIPLLDFDTSFDRIRTSTCTNHKEHQNNPPTGPTKDLKYGFIVFCFIIFSLMTIFLSYLN